MAFPQVQSPRGELSECFFQMEQRLPSCSQHLTERSPDGTASSEPRAQSVKLRSITVPPALLTQGLQFSILRLRAISWLPTSAPAMQSRSTTAPSTPPHSPASSPILACTQVTLPSPSTLSTTRFTSHMHSGAPPLPDRK